MNFCQLCKQKSELQTSHIVPSFLFNWLAKTSSTGFFRSAKQPNIRIQDGWKLPLLCRDCEKLFSKWETCFANMIFYRFINEYHRSHNYSEWLLRFCVSVSWRVLNYILHIDQLKHFDETTAKNVSISMNKWRNYLLNNQIFSAHELNHHLYFLEELSEANEDDNVFINRFFQRTLDFDLISHEDEEFVYIKFPYFILIGFLGEQGKEQNWRGAEVLKKGEFKPSSYFMPWYFWDFINEKCDRVVKVRQSYSEKQLSKICKTMEKNPEQYNASHTKKAFEKDFELFGTRARVDKKR